MRLQNARNLGGGSLINGSTGADGEYVYLCRNGSTVKVSVSGANGGTVCKGVAIVLSGGIVTEKGGQLHYESV